MIEEFGLYPSDDVLIEVINKLNEVIRTLNDMEAANTSTNKQSMPYCYDCGGVPGLGGKIIHVDGCRGD